MRDLVSEAKSVIASGDSSQAFRLFTDRYWKNPPEPDWLPESRVWRLLPEEIAIQLLQKVLEDPKVIPGWSDGYMDASQLSVCGFVEAVLYFKEVGPHDVADWDSLLASIPDHERYVRQVEGMEREQRREHALAEVGSSSFGEPYSGPFGEEDEEEFLDLDDEELE